MYRVITIDGTETNRELAGFEEVLAANPEVAASYRDNVQTKLEELVAVFEASSEISSVLHEKAAIALVSLDLFVLSYSENMLAPVTP
jgi:tellurite resistance protein